MVTSSNVETELRTTVLPSIDITITTLSPLSGQSEGKIGVSRESDLLARVTPTTTTTTTDDDDGVTPSQRATVGAEVTTTTTTRTAATELPNQNHDNPMMDQTGTLPQSPPENADEIEEDGPQQNIPVLNVDVNDLIPSLQDEGLAQIKKYGFPKIFHPNSFNYFCSQTFYLTITIGVPQAQQLGSSCKL